MADPRDLAVALGEALTGERLPLEGRAPLIDELAAAGFDADRLARIRADRQAGELPWPFAVGLDERRSLGFARFDAALTEARASLGLDGLRPASKARRPLNADERRLSEDRPPHWG